MINFGIVHPGTTLYIEFDSFAGATGASITLTGLAVTDVEVYRDGSVTQRSSDSGYTLLDTDGIDVDAITGIHGLSIDLADNTDAGFWRAGSHYRVVISSVTIDSQTVSFTAATFRIGYSDAILNTTIATLASQTSFTLTAGPAEDDALNGSIVLIHDVASAVQKGFAVVSDYTGATKTVTLTAGTTFTAAATDNISFFPPVNAAYGGGVAYSTTRGLAGTALPNAAADAAGGLPISDAGGLDLDAQNSNVSAVKTKTDFLPSATAGANGGVFIAGTNAATTITTALTANITGNLSGSVGSVTGAVGSVTGNVGGNVAGSVGSVTGNVGGNVTGSIGSLATQAKADVNAEADTAISDAALATAANLSTVSTNVSTLLTRIPAALFSGITSLAQWLGLIAGKQTGDSTARTELRATGAGSGTYDETTDSAQAIRDRGDAAWITATGFSTLDAAGVRTAVGLASANLDTQLGDIPTVAEFEARTLLAAAYFDPAADTVANVTTVGSVTTKTGYSLASTGLDSISTTAPSGVASTFPGMVIQIWRRFFKKSTLTATQLKTYADDGSTVVTTQTVSDDGTTQTQGAAT